MQRGRAPAVQSLHGNPSNLRRHTLALLRRYQRHFPQESGRHALLERQLLGEGDPFIRANMTGHVTSSALVLNQAGSKVVLIHHKTFNRWLPPGGHYEPPGSLWHSAQREVTEETGLAEMKPHPWMLEHRLPVDIDSHAIGAHQGKGEAAHWHHDLRFLVQASEHLPLLPQLEEVHAVKWAPLSDLRDSSSGDVRALHAKLARLGIV